MSAFNQSMPSQPSKSTAYETGDNPVSKEPAEARAAQYNDSSDSYPTEQRMPQQQSGSIDDATPSAMGQGIRGAGAGEEARGYGEEDVGRHQELDAQQMAAPGEGEVASAVEGKTKRGASGQQEDLVADIDRKKAEQAPYRDAIQESRREDVDVGGVLGQRGGPANPVDQGGYPNSGD
ncbi:hypothetical protein NA57DRAFT_55503 [Rhizodiscina lignyota]|uniref:Uncharacterized protein n=1 Tax=Rhizodiscina lignyota TaxID=1504668 RepID=A0A9P4IHX6_9PEZI|nr:hypothetical protein NA57DRAFT_55503 [Rhizodiscina lignyota]